jgi:hypothetical protein
MTATPGTAELLAISKARAANMRDLAGDLEIARDAYLAAMESQNADAMAVRREVLERMLWDDKGLIIAALRLAAEPAEDVREALKFYADTKNYRSGSTHVNGMTRPIMQDGGAKARAALSTKAQTP